MRRIKQDSTDVELTVFAVDAVSGQPRTGLAFGDVTVRYRRSGLASVSVTPVTLASPGAAHADGGFVEIDAADMMGLYRFDPPDAAWTAGADVVDLILQADGVLFRPVTVELVDATVGEVQTETHLCKAALVNRRRHTVSTGVDEILDDDGQTVLVTLTPTDGGADLIEVVPS